MRFLLLPVYYDINPKYLVLLLFRTLSAAQTVLEGRKATESTLQSTADLTSHSSLQWICRRFRYSPWLR